MKTKIRTTLVVFLLLLAGGLAWKFWSVENSAAAAKPDAPKVADVPKPTPSMAVKVELPKVAPAKPGDAPEPAQPMSQNTQAAEPPPNLAFPADASTGITNISDLGEIYFTSGVPQQLTLTDGTPVTVTATIPPGGGVQLRLETEQHNPDGSIAGKSTMMMTTSGSGRTLTMTMGGPQGKNTIKITPHVN